MKCLCHTHFYKNQITNKFLPSEPVTASAADKHENCGIYLVKRHQTQSEYGSSRTVGLAIIPNESKIERRNASSGLSRPPQYVVVFLFIYSIVSRFMLISDVCLRLLNASCVPALQLCMPTSFD